MRRPTGSGAGLLLALAVVSLGACSTRTLSAAQLSVGHAWARPTPGGATNGVVYLDVLSPVADSIVSVTVPTDVASAAELHETMTTGGTSPMANMPQMATGGTMTMAPVSAVDVRANEVVRFTPGGLHIMLVGLRHSLTMQQHFTITLHLKVAGAISTDVLVSNEAPSR